jgi:hypothetical protein
MFKHYVMKARGECLITGKGAVVQIATREENSPFAITLSPASCPSTILRDLSHGGGGKIIITRNTKYPSFRVLSMSFISEVGKSQ